MKSGMKMAVCFTFLIMLLGMGVFVCAEVDNNRKVIVEIDFGENGEVKRVEASMHHGQTVLEVLQTVATVETHPVGEQKAPKSYLRHQNMPWAHSQLSEVQ